jgi:hypothetical protein
MAQGHEPAAGERRLVAPLAEMQRIGDAAQEGAKVEVGGRIVGRVAAEDQDMRGLA